MLWAATRLRTSDRSLRRRILRLLFGPNLRRHAVDVFSELLNEASVSQVRLSGQRQEWTRER